MKKIFILFVLFAVSFVIGAGLTYAKNEGMFEGKEKKFYESFLDDSKEFLEKTGELYDKYINNLLDKKEDTFNAPENPLESLRVKGLLEVLTAERPPRSIYEAYVLYKAMPYDNGTLFAVNKDADKEFHFIYGVIIKKEDNYYIVKANEFGIKYFKFRVIESDSVVLYEVNDKVEIIGQLMRYQKLEMQDKIYDIPVFRAVYVEGESIRSSI